MSEIKPCPCGKTPGKLYIMSDSGNTPKWARVSGDCCGDWEIEYRNSYEDIAGPDAMKLARQTWNEAPRGTYREG